MLKKTLLLVLLALIVSPLGAINDVPTPQEEQVAALVAQIPANEDSTPDEQETVNKLDGIDPDLEDEISRIWNDWCNTQVFPPGEITTNDIPDSPKAEHSSPFWFKVRLLKAYLTLQTELAKQHIAEHKRAYIIASTLAGLGLLTAGSIAYLIHHNKS